MNFVDDNREGLWQRYLAVAIGILFLVLGNYIYFVKAVSSNEDVITRYHSPEDPLETYKNPPVVGIFFAGEHKSVAENPLLGQKKTVSFYPKIIISPHTESEYVRKALAKIYKSFAEETEKAKKIIVLVPSQNVSLQKNALFPEDILRTSSGRWQINEKIYHNLAKIPGFSYDQKAYKQKDALEQQLLALQRMSPNFEIVPIAYGNSNPQELAEILYPYVRRKDTLLVVLANLVSFHGVELIPEAGMEKPETLQRPIEAIGINSALILAQLMQLRPQLLSLINGRDGEQERQSAEGSHPEKTEMAALSKEVEALRQFVADYGADLRNIAGAALQESAIKQRKYQPSRQEYDENLFNRGASFVLLSGEKIYQEIGSLYPRQAIAADIADNVYKAVRAVEPSGDWSADKLADMEISVFLLSGYQEIQYNDEEDLLSKLQPDIDGLLIYDGDRQGIFLPSAWKKFPDRKEFLQQLKLKAGMNPGYWADSIKVYRFRTVEVK